MKTRVFGYCRISTPKQVIGRQIDNIKSQYPDAIIFEEEYTGTKIDRPIFNKMLKGIKTGDTIVFDEVSRMSRTAEEGMELYTELFDMGVNLVFIKEPHINTSVYRDKMQIQKNKISSTGSKATDKLLDSIMEALHDYTIDLATEQIELAFKRAQEEVEYLHKRTAEGVKRAQERYERESALGLEHEKENVGRKTGVSVVTKKSISAKKIIEKHSKDFNGTLCDADVIKLTGLSRNTFYKYKRELKEA